MKIILNIFVLFISIIMIDISHAISISDGYVGVNYGLGSSNKFLFYDPSLKRSKHSQVLELAAGYRIKDNFRVELAFNKFHNFKYKNTYTENLETYSQNISSNAIFGKFYFDRNEFKRLSYYVNLGFGIYRNKPNDILILRGNTEETVGRGKSGGGFAWNVGAGVFYELNNNITLNLLSYNYNVLGHISSEILVEPSYITKLKLRIHSVTTGIKIKLGE